MRGQHSLGEHWEFEKSMRVCASNAGRSFLMFVRWNRIRKYEATPMQRQRVQRVRLPRSRMLLPLHLIIITLYPTAPVDLQL